MVFLAGEQARRQVDCAGHGAAFVVTLECECDAVHINRVENGRSVCGEPRPLFLGTVLPALGGAADLDGSERISPPVVAAPFRLQASSDRLSASVTHVLRHGDEERVMFTDYIKYLPLLSMGGWIAMFASKHKSLFLGDCMGLLYHLALVPVVALLPGSVEIKFAGYLWLFSDALVDMASINGAGQQNVWTTRMCVHLVASIWIIGASLGMSGAALFIGVALGAGLFLHALLGPRIDKTKQVLGVFVVPGMIAWLLSIAQWLGAFTTTMPGALLPPPS